MADGRYRPQSPSREQLISLYRNIQGRRHGRHFCSVAPARFSTLNGPGLLYRCMKKTIILLVIAIAVITLSIVSYNDRADRELEGSAAPELNLPALETGAPGLSLADLKGQYVVVSFWSAADPASRMRNMDYENIVNKIDSGLTRDHEPLAFVSVNFDSSGSLVSEIAAIDGLDPASIARAEGASARRLIDEYNLDDGFDAFLVDPSGRIVGRNPSEEELLEAVS